jgi:hypothetical protein
MDHSAVPPGLVPGHGLFFLDYDEVDAGFPGQELSRHRKTNDSTTDDADSLGCLEHIV